MRELLGRSFNHYGEPEASFRALIAVVREVRVWRTRYEQAHELAAMLADQLGVSSSVDSGTR